MTPLTSTRPGFALPVAVLVIGFVTAGVVAAFTRTSAEVRTVDNWNAQTTAFAVAQAGLERYVARGRVTPADTTMNLTGGSARVRVTLMRPAIIGVTDTAIYLIRSEATTAGGNGIPQGRRTVAQFAYKLRGKMQVLSAWTSISGLLKHGVAGDISGVNHCGTDTIPAVMLPTGTFTMSGGRMDQVLTGNPPLVEAGSQTDLASQVKIDWANIVDPTAPALAPDYIVCVRDRSATTPAGAHADRGRRRTFGSTPASGRPSSSTVRSTASRTTMAAVRSLLPATSTSAWATNSKASCSSATASMTAVPVRSEGLS